MNKQTANLLEQHFDTAFSASDGIKKLRELILTLAMQGKLVEQDPNDQPASELLKEIEAEKQRLVTAGKIKKLKALLPIKAEEVPYELPDGWEWVRLTETYFGIGNKQNQIQTKDYLEKGRFPVIDQGKSFIAGYCNENSLLLHIDRPVIIFGDHTKNIKYVDFDFVIGADGVKILCPFRPVLTRFLYFLALSYNLTDRGYARHFKVLNEKMAPLPPLPEQHRIVARIDQLTARCDELEKLRNQLEEKRLAVHAAAIRQLLDAPDGSAWDFIQQHFNELYSVKENVAELRKAILQLAVTGKLVPQDPNDPPASELLKEIEAEKKRLERAGKVKKLKLLPYIKPEELPYQLPRGWEWVTFLDVGFFLGGKTPSKNNSQYWDGCIPWVSPKDMKCLELQDSEDHVTVAGVDSGLAIIPIESLLMVVRSGILRRTFPVAINNVPCTINQDLKALVPYQTECSNYLLLMLRGFEQFILEKLTKQGVTVESLKFDEFANTKFPCPPFPEQRRIVARIDQLMALCDQLGQQIDIATSKQTELLNAVMVHVE
ncbi:MAG TPA: restriction endonuclease subunit S [Chlorobaculum sp.]|nr:restriction endonuclease subunit S [Chlorobaculum sp.]